jgi:hypothetical protein
MDRLTKQDEWGTERGRQRRFTFGDKGRSDLLTLLSVTYEAESDSGALPGQPAVVFIISDVPYFSEHGGRELGASKDADGGVATENAILCVCVREYLGGELHFARSWREAGHRLELEVLRVDGS